MREITLDTETTGFYAKDGDRIIEIGCVELGRHGLTKKKFHVLINPERQVGAQAIAVHHISNEMLADKPTFDKIADEFIDFIKGAKLIIHNAPFDVGFLDEEFRRIGKPKVSDLCEVVDSLELAKAVHPQMHNSLDALCKRYGINTDRRVEEGHGALLDAELLGQVYLVLRQSQASLDMTEAAPTTERQTVEHEDASDLPVIKASEDELAEHEKVLSVLRKKSEAGVCYDDSDEVFAEKRRGEKEKLDKAKEQFEQYMANL